VNRKERREVFIVWLTNVAAVLLLSSVHAAEPEVHRVQATQRAGTGFVDIDYDISDDDGDSLTVSIAVEVAGNPISAPSMSGDVGTGVSAGNSRKIVWNASADWGGQFSDQVSFVVTADDLSIPPAPSDMVLIPGGSFNMGDAYGEGDSDELPVHSVNVSAFYMGRYEVTKALWDEVASWASSHGYDISAANGSGKTNNHPVVILSWSQCVKWCNARSEKEGRTPAYYTTSTKSTVYRSGYVNVTNDSVRWDAGYRLPTEAEWEYAARGGLSGQRFPWGANINHDHANYRANGSAYGYDTSPYTSSTYHPDYDDGGAPFTSPVGSFAANGYGLHDMSGNVWEWCWDRYDESYYGSSPGSNPRGPASGSPVFRGGSWLIEADGCRVANRDNIIIPHVVNTYIGFRTVLPTGQ
jgi:sulfatase modifying factor 1